MKQQRESYEYKLSKPSKSLKDFARYIKYERSLLVLIHERRKSRAITEKKGTIDFKIASRIIQLYHQAIQRFSSDIKIWDDFIKFCVISKKKTEVPVILDKMVKVKSIELIAIHYLKQNTLI